MIQLANAPLKKAAKTSKYKIEIGKTLAPLSAAVCQFFSLVIVACSLAIFSFNSERNSSSSEGEGFFGQLERDTCLKGELDAKEKLSSFCMVPLFKIGFSSFFASYAACLAKSIGLEYAFNAYSELDGVSTIKSATFISVLFPVPISICSLYTCRTYDKSGQFKGEVTEVTKGFSILYSFFSYLINSFSFRIFYFYSVLISFYSCSYSFLSCLLEVALTVKLTVV